jgi:polyphosphate kinase 2 (PPK2 family)
MKRNAYEEELRKLQVKLRHLQEFVKTSGLRMMLKATDFKFAPWHVVRSDD